MCLTKGNYSCSLPYSRMEKHQTAVETWRNFRKKGIDKISNAFLKSSKSEFLRGILWRSVKLEAKFMEWSKNKKLIWVWYNAVNFFKDFTRYFEECIDPDMGKMGVWALRDYGLFEVLSTNRSESWNALVKREFVKKRGYTEDEIIRTSFEIVKRRTLRVKKAQYRAEEKWKIRNSL